MRTESTGTLSVSFSSAPDGLPLSGGSPVQRTVDFGEVSYAQPSPAPNLRITRRQGSFVVGTHFGLDIEDAAQHIATATVLAAVAVPDPFFSFRLDGVLLGTTPQTVQGSARVGVIARHLLEIEVPASLTEKNSQLRNAIVFQVIAN